MKTWIKRIYNMKNISLMAAAIILTMAGCFSPYAGDGGEASLTINLGDSGRAVALDKWSPLVHSEMFGLIEYRVLFSGGGGTIERSAKGVTVIQTTITAGLWDVEVQATVNGERYGRGTGSVEVKAGQANSARIQMYQWYYELGDRGPGGGIIFHVANGVGANPSSMTINGYGSPGEPGYFATYTAHYLEAAPVEQSMPWASSSHSDTNISGTGNVNGVGRRNTALILAIDADAPAASACRTYTGGGKNDWFLPSRDEIQLIWTNRDINGIGAKLNIQAGAHYWTSGQGSPPDFAMGANFSGSGGSGSLSKAGSRPVRAIRAF